MGLLAVDENKCKKDGICVAECPMAIIKLKDGQGLPQMVPGGEPFCITCGHCVAVCPHGALSHTQVPLLSVGATMPICFNISFSAALSPIISPRSAVSLISCLR